MAKRKPRQAKRRKAKHGEKLRERTGRLLAIARRLAPPGADAERAAYAVWVCVQREALGMSYRRLEEFLGAHPGLLEELGMGRTPASKSSLHNMSKGLRDAGSDWLPRVLAEFAGVRKGDAIIGDSTGFSMLMYEQWLSVKYGRRTRRTCVKAHVLMREDLTVVALAVTRGSAHDSPPFRELYRLVPDGTGDVVLDAGYDARENCRIIARSGRRPVIDHRKDAVTGYDPRGQMVRWKRTDPEGFAEAYKVRNLVESLFSSVKKRFGTMIRAKSLPMRTVEVFARFLCHNLSV